MASMGAPKSPKPWKKRLPMCPVAELYADLEGGHRLAHEIGFVDAEPVVEDVDRGQRRLADADGTDLLGFDELYLGEAGLEEFLHRSRRHPAGRSPADDDDLADGPWRRDGGHSATFRLHETMRSTGTMLHHEIHSRAFIPPPRRQPPVRERTP